MIRGILYNVNDNSYQHSGYKSEGNKGGCIDNFSL